jgi:hypothetical protein
MAARMVIQAVAIPFVFNFKEATLFRTGKAVVMFIHQWRCRDVLSIKYTWRFHL